MNAANLAVMGPTEPLPVIQSETRAMISMFERLARDPSVPMERIERVMDMLSQLRKEQAEEAFNEAMAQTQQELTPVARDSFNPQTRSKYASYHATDIAIRPIYTKHGIAVSFDEGDGAPEGHIRLLAFVTKGRHQRTYRYDSPVITTGLAGKTNMTLTHARASAVTYARRYLVGMIFNLSTGEDTDGAPPREEASADYTPPPGSISPAQVEELRLALEVKGATEKAFVQWTGKKRIEDIPAEKFDVCKRAISKFNNGGQQ